jgi:diketogulonate reductase-like aldo/keto reductase
LYENINVFDFNLTDDEMSKILKLEQKEKIIIIPGIQNHPDYPFHPQDQ